MIEFAEGRATLHAGDCLAVLDTLDANSIDAVVCDPPYGLAFMGKGWDSPDNVAFRPETWAKVLRVMKPGAHLVAFGGTRTYHRLVCAIEDAGFEVRDQIGWLFGTGFPKSLDVSKGIDRKRDDSEAIETVRAWLEDRRFKAGVTRKAINEAMGLAGNGGGLASSWTTNKTTACVPQWEQWICLKELLNLSDEMDGEVWRLNGRKGQPGEAWNARDKIRVRARPETSGTMVASSDTRPWIERSREVGYHETAGKTPATDLAKQWSGFGTALKPAHEPICLARKPLIGTVVENVLAHGTGALNIDGCRIATSDKLGGGGEKAETAGQFTNEGWRRPWMDDPTASEAFAAKVRANVAKAEQLGRWPANICHDGSDEVLDLFPETGAAKSSNRGLQNSGRHGGIADIGRNIKAGTDSVRGHDDAGGSAARFFYCSKASKAERAGSNHPTVKPQALMRYLCRLVTPPNGTVLDPFAGSGSTLAAALSEGFRAIGIEREDEYIADTSRRLTALTEC